MNLRVFRIFKLIRREILKETKQGVGDSKFNTHMKLFLKENF